MKYCDRFVMFAMVAGMWLGVTAEAQTIHVTLNALMQSDAEIADPTADAAARDLAFDGTGIVVGGWYNEGTRSGFYGFFDLDLNPDVVPFSTTGLDSEVETVSPDGDEGGGRVNGFAARGPVGGALSAITTAGPGKTQDLNSVGQAVGNIGGTPFIDDGATLLPLPHQSGTVPFSTARAITDLGSGNTVYGSSSDDSTNGDAGSWTDVAGPFFVIHEGGPSGAQFLAATGSWLGGSDDQGSDDEVLVYNGSIQQNILGGPVRGMVHDITDFGVSVGGPETTPEAGPLGQGFIGIPATGNDYNVFNFQSWYLGKSGVDIGSIDVVTSILVVGDSVYISYHNVTDSGFVKFPLAWILPDADNDGVPDAVEAAGPFLGAATDSAQAALPIAADGRYVLLQTSQGQFSDVSAVTVTPPAGQTAPVGFFDFTVDGLTPGSSTLISITVPDGTLVDDYLKWDGSNNFSSLPFSVNGSEVSFTLTDGGMGDQDGMVNGRITDPSGPVVNSTPPHTKSFWLLY